MKWYDVKYNRKTKSEWVVFGGWNLGGASNNDRWGGCFHIPHRVWIPSTMFRSRERCPRHKRHRINKKRILRELRNRRPKRFTKNASSTWQVLPSHPLVRSGHQQVRRKRRTRRRKAARGTNLEAMPNETKNRWKSRDSKSNKNKQWNKDISEETVQCVLYRCCEERYEMWSFDSVVNEQWFEGLGKVGSRSIVRKSIDNLQFYT